MKINPVTYATTVNQIKQNALKNLEMFDSVTDIVRNYDDKITVSLKGKEEFKKLFFNSYTNTDMELKNDGNVKRIDRCFKSR